METIEQIDVALSRLPITPTTDADLLERARLTQRRGELVNAERDRAATPRKSEVGILVNVPDGDGTSLFVSRSGRTALVEVVDGRRVVRLQAGELQDLICANGVGLAWQKANEALLAQLARP